VRRGEPEIGPHRGEPASSITTPSAQRPAAASHPTHGARVSGAPISAPQPHAHRRDRASLRLQRGREDEGRAGDAGVGGGTVRTSRPATGGGVTAPSERTVRSSSRISSGEPRRRAPVSPAPARSGGWGCSTSAANARTSPRAASASRGAAWAARAEGWSELCHEPREREAVGRLAGRGNEGLEVAWSVRQVRVPGVAVLRQQAVEDGLDGAGRVGTRRTARMAAS
jgi:hypothetical protein